MTLQAYHASIQILSIIYDAFRPTWSSSGNTHYTQNPWDEISNTKFRKRKRDLILNCF